MWAAASRVYFAIAYTPYSSDINEATMNVQIASGCIKNWYELRVGVSRCYSKVLLQQRIVAMPRPVLNETRTSKSCIKTACLGPAVRNGRRFPRQRVELVPETQEPSPYPAFLTPA